MRFPPRWYQSDGHAALREHFRNGKRRLVAVMPTGAGKTGLAAMIIEAALSKGSKILFLAHRKELITQCSKTLDDFGVEHGVIKAKHWRDRPSAPVQVASVQTLIKRSHRPEAQIVVLDEAHRSLNATNQTIIGWYPEALVLGLTATPERLDGRGLDEIFQAMVEPITMTRAVAEGFLLPCKVFEPDRPDLRGIGKTAGDFDNKQLAAKLRGNPRRVGNLVENWLKLGEDRQTVCFAINREDSRAIVERYKAAGVAAEHLDGEMSETARDAILERFASGQTRVVSNCDVLVEGYDLPSIGCIQLARPTISITRFLQMIGRGSRPFPGMKYFVVLDHAGCVERLGDPIRDWPWSLQGRRWRAEKEDLAEIKMVTCEKCSRMRPASLGGCPECSPKPPAAQVAMFASLPVELEGFLVERTGQAPSALKDDAKRCRKCGSSHIAASRQSDLKIMWRCTSCKATEFVVDKDAAAKASEDRRFAEYLALERARRRQGRQPSWSAHVYKSVFGVWPAREWMTKINGILGSQENKS